MSYTESYIKSLHGVPTWEAIWEVIKKWDIRREDESGYHGPTGDGHPDLRKSS